MKKLLIQHLVALITLAFLCSCSEKKSDTIRIGVLNGPTAVSAIQLIDQPIEVEGKKVEIIIKNEPQQIQAMMMQDNLDFAILPTVMAANLYNKGVHYRMLACPVWGTLYILTNSKAKKLSHLQGQTISVFGQSSTADVLLQRLIQRNDIPDVHIDYTLSTNNEVAQALLLKKIKFGVVSEPLVSKILAEDPNVRIVGKLTCEEFFQNSDKNIFVQTAFLVSDKFIKENYRAITPVCEAYSNSCNFTNTEPQKTALMMVNHKLAPNTRVAWRSIPLCNIHYVGAFALQQEISSYLKIFYQFNPKSIGNAMPDSKFVFTPIAPGE